MSSASKAVFLSYASQDAAAARNICDALRSDGVEVWFDSDGGLEHGDEWDAKIRKQIKECVLFIPVISATTQARHEGYFRLEWDLAAERARTIASGVPFILPIVIDETCEPDALVPDRFRAVQWTRLRDGKITPEVQQRLLKIWSHRIGLLSHQQGQASAGGSRSVPPLESHSANRRVAWPIAAAVMVCLSLLGWTFLRSWDAGDRAAAAKESRGATLADNAAPPISEARKLLAQARAIFGESDYGNREDFFVADDLLKAALALDATDGEIWAAQAQLSRAMLSLGYDRTSARYTNHRRQAERALKLAPDSVEAQIAYAGYLTTTGEGGALEAVQRLQRLNERGPQHRSVTLGLAYAFSAAGRVDEAVAAYDKANALAGADPIALGRNATQLLWYGRYEEAQTALDNALAMRATGLCLVLDVVLKLCWRGDLDAAAAALERWPTWLLLEDRGAFVASQVWLWRREPDKAVAVLNAVNRDSFNDTYFTGPKSALLALAHEMAGRKEAARAEWENTVRVANRLLVEDATLKRALAIKACALARLGDAAQAESLLRELVQTRQLQSEFWSCAAPSAFLRIALGHGSEVAEKFDTEPRAVYLHAIAPSPQAALRLNPVFDAVRSDPAFQRLIAAAPKPKTPVTIRPPAAAEKSVAVLRFANRSDDPANEYFSDGISEELINVLAKIPGFKVSARTSAFHFKKDETPITEIGRQLGVAYVVEGSVRKVGTRVRITAQLIKADDSFHVWSDNFERELKDIFAVQDEIAGLIAKNLSLKLGDAAPVPVSSVAPTSNLAAYDTYLRARALQTAGYSMTARYEMARLYEEAVRLDPGYALAWARLSQVYMRGRIGRDDRSPQNAAKAKAAAAHALRLAPHLPEARVAMAMVRLMVDYDFDAAQRELDEAERLRPNDPEIPSARAYLERARGNWGEGLSRVVARAVELDPQNASVLSMLGIMLSETGRYADAERLFIRAWQVSRTFYGPIRYRAENHVEWTGDVTGGLAILESVPEVLRDTPLFYIVRADLHHYRRDFPAAIADYEKVRTFESQGGNQSPGLRTEQAVAKYRRAEHEQRLGQVSVAKARLGEALEAMRQLVQEFPDDYRPRAHLAAIYAVRGDRAEALAVIAEALRLAGETRDSLLIVFTRIVKAGVLTKLGELEAAVDELRAVHDMGHSFGFRLRLNVAWEPLRDLAKFRALMQEAEGRANAVPRSKS